MATPAYDGLIRQVEERSAALRSAARDRLDADVPGCPGWTVRDLVLHVGDVQRFWAAAVAAGPAAERPTVRHQEAGKDLIAWSTGGTARLTAALRGTRADSGAWTWWGEPRRVDAIARHQVQEAAVHAWDAQEAAGSPEPLPDDMATDGVDEFLAIVERCAVAWPDPPGTVSLMATDTSEAAWVVRLLPAGAKISRAKPKGEAVLRGSASDLVLALYGRRGVDSVRCEGDADLATRFLAWNDTD